MKKRAGIGFPIGVGLMARKEYDFRMAPPSSEPQYENDKLLNEYRDKYELYADFAEKTASILEQVLKEAGYKYQPVSHRAKKPSSADARFVEKKCRELGNLKDLAGCRVIFYLESDIETFIRKVYETFGEDNVVDHENKISTDGYNAIHLVIQLGQDRLVHPEYKRFEGLKCEIQVTTVLHHAWSEMEHDLIYKPQKELTQFDARAFEAIREAFKKTMTEHIIPATRDFEHVFREHEKLKQGKGVFNVAFLKKMEEASSLNEIQEELKLLVQYVKEFGDKTPQELNLIDLIKKLLIKSKTLKPEAIKTVFGRVKGSKRDDIVLSILEILDFLRYWHIEMICEICLDLIKTERDQKIVSKATEVLKNICKYDLRILNTGGYHPQKTALDFLKKSGALEERNTISAVATMLGEVLSLSFQGISESSYKSITFQPTTLNPTKGLKLIRKTAIEDTKTLYGTAKNVKEKKMILNVLEQALRSPEYPITEKADELDKMLARDTKSILTFYVELLEHEENEVIQEIESHLVFLLRHPTRVTPQVERLFKLIRDNMDYQIFKVFVGFDVGFYPDLDFEKAKNYRNTKIGEYIEDITPETLNRWKKILRKITKNYKESDPGIFMYFNQFLFELGEQKPDIALTLINEKSLEPFLIHLVAGVWKSDKKLSAKLLLFKWATQYRNFVVCATIFDHVEEIDIPLFKRVVAKAIQKKDVRALNALVASIGRNYKGQPVLKTAFLQIVEALTTLKNTYWTNHIWFRKSLITRNLTRAQYKVLLENLLLTNRLDWHTEEVLQPLVEKYPIDFIDFLLKRVEYSKQFKGRRDIISRYDAIPHSFDRLGESLKKTSKVIIPAILTWFSMGEPKKDQWLYRWEAAHLLKDIFPGSDPLLQNELIDMIRRGGKDSEAVIHSFISRFEGEDFLWTLVQEIVAAYKDNDAYPDMKRSLFGYLSQTGVVSGEYGFVEAHSSKKESLVALKTEANPDFLTFLREYEEYLEKLIAGERKRADDDIDRRKREYGS